MLKEILRCSDIEKINNKNYCSFIVDSLTSKFYNFIIKLMLKFLNFFEQLLCQKEYPLQLYAA